MELKNYNLFKVYNKIVHANINERPPIGATIPRKEYLHIAIKYKEPENKRTPAINR